MTLNTKKPRGRPSIEPGTGKESLVSIRFSSDERNLYEAMAEAAGQTLSAWVRGVLANAQVPSQNKSPVLKRKETKGRGREADRKDA